MSISVPIISIKSIIFNYNKNVYPLPSIYLSFINGFGIAFRFKFSSSLTTNAVVFSINQSNNNNRNLNTAANNTNLNNFLYLQYTSANTFTIYYQNIYSTNGRIGSASTAFTINPDQIYNIIITYDITGTPALKVYINNNLYINYTSVLQTDLPATGQYNYNFLGTIPDNDGTFNSTPSFIGNIYSFAIYSYSLNSNDSIQLFSSDTSLSSVSFTPIANPKLSISSQLSIPQYNKSLSSFLPIFDNTSDTIIFKGNNYIQYSNNLDFAKGFSIILKFKMMSFYTIYNETLMSIYKNNQINTNIVNFSSIPIPNSIIIQRYGITNNLVINFIPANAYSSSSIITNTQFLKGITYIIIITYDGISYISVYVNGILDIATNI